TRHVDDREHGHEHNYADNQPQTFPNGSPVVQQMDLVIGIWIDTVVVGMRRRLTFNRPIEGISLSSARYDLACFIHWFGIGQRAKSKGLSGNRRNPIARH